MDRRLAALGAVALMLAGLLFVVSAWRPAPDLTPSVPRPEPAPAVPERPLVAPVAAASTVGPVPLQALAPVPSGAPLAPSASPATKRARELDAVPWNDLHPDEWMNAADELAELLPSMPTGTPEQRAERLGVLLQIARAAENGNQGDADYFPRVAGKQVSWHMYQAAGMSLAEPDLVGPATAGMERASVDGLKTYEDMIRNGELPRP